MTAICKQFAHMDWIILGQQIVKVYWSRFASFVLKLFRHSLAILYPLSRDELKRGDSVPVVVFGTWQPIRVSASFGFEFQECINIFDKRPPSQVCGSYLVTWYSYTSWTCTSLNPCCTSNRSVSRTHVTVSALSASVSFVQSSVRFCCIAQDLHRKNSNLLLQRNGKTQWNRCLGGSIEHIIKPSFWSTASISRQSSPT
jgi:hypothetical protein